MRADLSAGQRITQAGHAIADFCAIGHPDGGTYADRWRVASNSLIIVSVPDEARLAKLATKAEARGIVTARFVEPDLFDELTAVAFGPSPKTWRLLSNCPLEGRQLDPEQDRRARERERKLRCLADEMRCCVQTAGVSIYQHGEQVREAFNELLDATLVGETPAGWRLPSWWPTYGARLAAECAPVRDRLSKLALVHDCGKPRCATVGDDGVTRFPGHADVSADTWAGVSPDDTDIVGWMRRDMVVHTLSGDGCAEFAKADDAEILLFMGIAELHANRHMFGGIEATSYKVKAKHFDRRGKAICKARYGDS